MLSNKSRLGIVVGVICLSVTYQSYGVGLADADAALARSDYASALPMYESLAQGGDPIAMVKLANLFQKGEGVKQDLARAVELYKQAAASGNADAQYSLGNLYLLGEGVQQDDDWAFTYYRQAAQQGHPLALKNVSEFYRAAGVSPSVASEQLKEAAPAPASAAPAEPDAAAIPSELSTDELSAIDRARGGGIQVELEPSVSAMTPNRIIGSRVAPSTTAQSRPTLAEIKQMLQRGEVAQARAELEILAGNDDREAQFLLAKTIRSTEGSQLDREQAFFWLRRAAEGGHADAQFDLAEQHMRGDGVPLDEVEAVSWYRAAARQGHPVARQRLARIYRDAGLADPDVESATPPPSKNFKDGER